VALTPPVVVDAPEPRGMRYGLIAAAHGPFNLPVHGAAGGVVYEPVSCGETRRYDADCHTDQDREVKTFDPAADWVTGTPVTVYGSLVCGSAGKTAAQIEEQVRRRFLNGEQTSAEEQLAAVLAAAGPTVVTAPDPEDLVSVVGELEQWLHAPTPVGGGYGYFGYLHAPPRIAAYAAAAQLLVADGRLMRTPWGSIWVFGAGYPDDGTMWITGQVALWRSPTVTVPHVPSCLDLCTNQYEVVAEREYVVTYDCVAASAVYDWIPQT